MRIHSDVFNAQTFVDAVHNAGLTGVWVEEHSDHGSRRRKTAYEVRLAAEAGRDPWGKARRPRNTGRYGSDGYDPDKAATYDEWGQFIAALFDVDPDAVVGPYDGVADFHAKTRYQFPKEAA